MVNLILLEIQSHATVPTYCSIFCHNQFKHAYDENVLKLVALFHDHVCCAALKEIIKRRGEDIGIILVHKLCQMKLVQIRNFGNFK